MVARTVAAGPVLRVQQPPAMVLNREAIDVDGQSVNQIIFHQPKTCYYTCLAEIPLTKSYQSRSFRVTSTQNCDIVML